MRVKLGRSRPASVGLAERTTGSLLMGSPLLFLILLPLSHNLIELA